MESNSPKRRIFFYTYPYFCLISLPNYLIIQKECKTESLGILFAMEEIKHLAGARRRAVILFKIKFYHATTTMSDFESSTENLERRTGIDRRQIKSPIFSKYLVKGMRAIPRRRADRQRHQRVDRYSSKILVIIVLILALSILDAIFTLVLVDNGAREANPLMAYFLHHSPLMFICIKYFLTCSAVILTLFCKDFYIFNTRVKAKILFLLLPLPFILVIPWQLHLIFFGF